LYKHLTRVTHTKGAICGAGTAYPSEVPDFPRRFYWGSGYSICSFLGSVLYIIVCPFVLFLLVIVLSVLLLTIALSVLLLTIVLSVLPLTIVLSVLLLTIVLSVLLLAIVLSVLPFTASDYSFGIFHVFLLYCNNIKTTKNTRIRLPIISLLNHLFVDISGVVDHHCLSFLFMMQNG
jgi:hypothetical protein